jgi:hypothetical protein
MVGDVVKLARAENASSAMTCAFSAGLVAAAAVSAFQLAGSNHQFAKDLATLIATLFGPLIVGAGLVAIMLLLFAVIGHPG